MHTAVGINSLGDAEIHTQAAQRIGIFARQATLSEQHDHVAQRHVHALVQCGCHTHGDVVRGCLGTRIAKCCFFVQDQLECTLQGCFNGGSTDLTVPLCGMPIATRKQCTWHVDRQKQRTPRAQFLVVQVATVGSWHDGADLPNLQALRQRIVLADGGVYDNMGLESLVDNVDLVLVSDAGAPFEVDESPAEDHVFQLGRVRDILIDQTRALRKRWSRIVSRLISGPIGRDSVKRRSGLSARERCRSSVMAGSHSTAWVSSRGTRTTSVVPEAAS